MVPCKSNATVLFAGSSQTKNYCIFVLLMPNFDGCGFCLHHSPPPTFPSDDDVGTNSFFIACCFRPPLPLATVPFEYVFFFFSSSSSTIEEEEGSVVAVSIEKSYSVSHGILPLSSTSSSAAAASAEWHDKTLRSRCASLSSSASHHHIRVISNAVAVREKCRCPFRYIHILLLPAEQGQGTDRRAKRTE